MPERVVTYGELQSGINTLYSSISTEIKRAKPVTWNGLVDDKFNIKYELQSDSKSDSIQGDYVGFWQPVAKGKEFKVVGPFTDSKIGGPDFYPVKILESMTPSKEQMISESVRLTITPI